MTIDQRFDDIVETTKMIGREGKYAKAVCLTCSQQYKVTREEFEIDTLYNLDGSNVIPDVDQEDMEYVAGMRAWNCCHEGEEPLDGFPKEPDIRHVEFGDEI